MCNLDDFKKPIPDGAADVFLGNIHNQFILEPCRELSPDEVELIKDSARTGNYVEITHEAIERASRAGISGMGVLPFLFNEMARETGEYIIDRGESYNPPMNRQDR